MKVLVLICVIFGACIEDRRSDDSSVIDCSGPSLDSPIPAGSSASTRGADCRPVTSGDCRTDCEQLETRRKCPAEDDFSENCERLCAERDAPQGMCRHELREMFDCLLRNKGLFSCDGLGNAVLRCGDCSASIAAAQLCGTRIVCQ
jgi:hypothetical protein